MVTFHWKGILHRYEKSSVPPLPVFLTLCIALEWTSDRIPLYRSGLFRAGPFPDFNSTMSEIIYELSGERRHRRDISYLLTNLESLKSPADARTVLDTNSRETKRTLEKIRKDCNALLSPSVARSASVGSLLQSVQDMASQLPVTVQNDRNFSSLMDQPNPTLNGSVNIFRELSRMVTISADGFRIYLDTPVPSSYFSLYLVSRFYRIDALPNLASSLIWDFGSNIELLHGFNQRLSPGSQCYLRHVKITMVDGFMLPKESQPLDLGRGLCDQINTALPSLRVLDIDLWPRDPTNTNTVSRAWGEQNDVLVRGLQYVKAKVRLRLRWVADCEKFEEECVRKGGWRCVGKDGPNNQSKENVGFSPRCYELHGSGDKEVDHHSSEM